MSQPSKIVIAVLTALALLPAAFGCSKAPTPVSGQANRSDATGKQDDAHADASLTVEQYVRLGMPAPDREWSPQDMLRAYEVLAALAKEDHQQLPRYQSERSGQMFARIASPQNLNQFKNAALPLEVRMTGAVSFAQVSHQLLSVYLSGFVNDQTRDTELVELTGMVFRMTVFLVSLVDEFLPTIKSDDPRYQVRIDGLEQMKRGMASMVAGTLDSLSAREYRTDELKRLISYLQETLPGILPQLSEVARTETALRLEKMQNDDSFNELQPQLGELCKAVKNAAIFE